jgi:hypothetical protein
MADDQAEPIDLPALYALSTRAFHMSWLALVEIRAFKAGVTFETWVAGLPRSAAGLPQGEFWVDAGRPQTDFRY